MYSLLTFRFCRRAFAEKTMSVPRLMVIELDGATWTVMKPLLDKGELPNLKKLIDRGASGVLMSDPPTISPKIWTTIFSGKAPEKHGIEFFGASAKMLRSKRIWDILGERGYTVGTFGTLVTWPPHPVNGFMIPSICALGTETFPEHYRFFQEMSLSERKKWKDTHGPILALWESLGLGLKLMSHGTSLRTMVKGAATLVRNKLMKSGMLDRYYRMVFLHLEMATGLLRHLLQKFKPDFCTWHIHTCDSIAHRYWAFHEPEPYEGKVDPKMIERLGHVITDSYRVSDRAIGKILKGIPENTDIIVISDHGGEAMPEAINPYSAKIDVMLDILQLKDKVVVARFGPGVHVKFNEKDRALQDLTQKRLSEARVIETGDPAYFVKPFGNTLVVTKPNERSNVEAIHDDCHVSFGDLGEYKLTDINVKLDMQMSGCHADEGIIIMAGPNIQKGIELPMASVRDITPTLLTLLGEAVGKDMDGKVIETALEPAFLEEKGVHFIDTYEDGTYDEIEDEEIDHEKLKERLAHLGYL